MRRAFQSAAFAATAGAIVNAFSRPARAAYLRRQPGCITRRAGVVSAESAAVQPFRSSEEISGSLPAFLLGRASATPIPTAFPGAAAVAERKAAFGMDPIGCRFEVSFSGAVGQGVAWRPGRGGAIHNDALEKWRQGGSYPSPEGDPATDVRTGTIGIMESSRFAMDAACCSLSLHRNSGRTASNAARHKRFGLK